MNRLIIPSPSPGRAIAASGSDADDALSRLVKYIPSEILSGYILLSGILDGATQESSLRLPAAWILFALGLVLTPLYLWSKGRPKGVQWWHLPISTLSFAFWAYALGGPFEMSDSLILGFPYERWFAAFLAGAFSWMVALLWKPVEVMQIPRTESNSP